MPTPSETTLPPDQQAPDESTTPHHSCPPEEIRDHPSRDAAHHIILPPHLVEQQNRLRALRAQQAQREEAQEGVSTAGTGPSPETQEKEDDEGILEEDSGVETSGPAPLPEAAGDSDARLAQSMSRAELSTSPSVQPQTTTNDRQRIPSSITSSFLRPGSKFKGTQQSDRQVYDVQVEIKDVNMAESFLCGYLRIQGLTDNHPTLTTYFEGEIIGPKHLFKTQHPSWGATEKIDLQHWARFPAWRPLARSVKSPNFTLSNYQEREHLFMRWKEYFLVPDHRVRTITGASFEGFYYICFNQCRGTVSGIYFHSKSERYQQLELTHVEDRGCVAAMEFR